MPNNGLTAQEFVQRIFSDEYGGQRAENPYLLSTPPRGGGMPFEAGLGMVNPMLQTIGSMLGVNEQMMRMMMGPGMAYYGGSFSQPTNQSNILSNQWSSTYLLGTVAQTQAALDQSQLQFNTSFYKNVMGFSPDEAARRGADAADSYTNPMGWALRAMTDTGFDKARVGLEIKKTASMMGIDTPQVFGYGGDYLTPARKEMLGIGEGGRYENLGGMINDNLRRSATIGEFFGDSTGQWAKNPFAHGGLTAGEHTAVAGRLIRTAAITESEMEGAYGEGATRDMAGGGEGMSRVTAAREKVQRKIKDMDIAVSSMKEVFGGEVTGLLEKMSLMFSSSTGGRDIAQRVSELKYTMAATGQSVQGMAEMIGVAQQYGGGLGATKAAGLEAAKSAALFVGPAADVPGVDMEHFREDALKRVVGAQNSGVAYRASGAYLMWLDKKKAKDSGEMRDEFQNALSKTDYSMGAMQELSGGSASSILMAAGGRDALRLREQTTLGIDAGLGAAQSQWEASRQQDINLSFRLLNETDAPAGAADMPLDELREMFGTADKKGAFDRQMDRGAQRFNFADALTMDQAISSSKAMKRREQQVHAKGELDSKLKTSGLMTNDLMGMAHQIGAMTGKEKNTYGGFFASAIGATTPEEIAAVANGLDAGVLQKGIDEAYSGDMDHWKRIQPDAMAAITSGISHDTGKALDESTRKRVLEWGAGKLSSAETRSLMEDLSKGGREDTRMSALREAGLEGAYGKEGISLSEQSVLTREALDYKAISTVMGGKDSTPAEKEALKGFQTGFRDAKDKQGFIGSWMDGTSVGASQLKKINEARSDLYAKADAGSLPGKMDDMLTMLLDVLKGIKTLMGEGKLKPG